MRLHVIYPTKHKDYYIDIAGNIYSTKSGETRKLSPELSNGYPRITIKRKHFKVHRIVAETLIPNPDATTRIQVDHINRIRSDNRVENLRWVTARENCLNRSYQKDYSGHTKECPTVPI